MENLAASAEMSGLNENDPRSIARWMKKMGREMDEELGDDIDPPAEEVLQENGAGEGPGEGEAVRPGHGLDEGEDAALPPPAGQDEEIGSD